MPLMQTRRRLLATLSSAGAAGLIGGTRSSAEEGPPETTTIRLAKGVSICTAPQYVANELLRGEGFTDIRYVDFTKADAGRAEAANIQPGAEMCARREADFTLINPVDLAPTLEAGVPITSTSFE